MVTALQRLGLPFANNILSLLWILHAFIISCFSYLSLQTFKRGLYGIDFLMAEVCHEELGTPGGVPCMEDVECFLYGCGCFVRMIKEPTTTNLTLVFTTRKKSGSSYRIVL